MGLRCASDRSDGGDCFLDMGDVGVRVIDLLSAIGADVSGD